MDKKLVKSERENNVKSIGKKSNILKIVIGLLVALIFICVIAYAIAINARTNKINKQANEYINNEDNTSTVFCSGKNIKLNENTLEMLKNNGLDLVVKNDDYIIKIDNASLEKEINIDLDIDDNGKGYNVNLINDGIKDLYVNVSKYTNDYITLLSNNEYITNRIEVVENFAKVALTESKNYTLEYIVPKQFELKEMIIKKNETKELELNLEEKDYTYGSFKIETESEGITIDNMSIKGNTIGEYTIKVSNKYDSKNVKITVTQPVEKIELSKTSLNLIKDNKQKVDATVLPEDAVNKEIEWTSLDTKIAEVDQEGNITAIGEGSTEIVVATKTEPRVEARVQVEVKNNITSISYQAQSSGGTIAGATYINGILLVNKTHPIPADYAPGLSSEAYQAFLNLRRDAAAAGFDIQLLSGYRSYETQRNLYNNYVRNYGQAEADTFSAKPGTSEHQTGLAMDVGWINDSYGDTPSGKWLAANCYKYGFIIRYLKGKESITGYKYEPWHIRYLGIETATKVTQSGLTLEEYLGAN